MPDELFPTATRFLLAPRGHPQKGATVGTESGTSILLPAQFAAFRKTRRLHEIGTPELVLRETAVIDVPKEPGEPITKDDLTSALRAAEVRRGDAWLVRTGWGEGAPRERASDAYMLESPYLSVEGARYLGETMKQQASDLLLVDTAFISRPDKHLVPEWTTMGPRPLCYPSEAATAYLQGYLEREVLEDWEADYVLAEAGITTVKRLVNCGAIQQSRIRVIVAPLRLVRGVGSTCRVVAVEGVQEGE